MNEYQYYRTYPTDDSIYAPYNTKGLYEEVYHKMPQLAVTNTPTLHDATKAKRPMQHKSLVVGAIMNIFQGVYDDSGYSDYPD